MSNEYKSLRTVIFEVQAAAAPTVVSSAKPQQKDERKKGEVWKTASGHYGARNPAGVVDYFEDQERAKAYSKGQGRGGSADHGKVDSSREVELDQDGYEKKPQPNVAKPTAAAAGAKPAAPQPAGGAAAPQAKTVASDTQSTAQPQSSQKGTEQKPAQASQQPEEDPEVQAVAGEDPKSEYDASEGDTETTKDTPGFRKTGIKAKFKSEEDKAKSVRKSKMIASAIKSGQMQGPKDDSESLTGNAKAERAYVAELNHAALSAGMGGDVFDHEPCSKMFSALGFCYDKEGKQTDKGIFRPEMPQLSGIVDTDRTDSVAYKEALKQAKRKKAASDKFKTKSPTKDQLKDITDDEINAAQPSNEEIGSEEVNFEDKFIEALKNAGYEIEEFEVNPSTLKPIQTQMQGSKVAGMYSTLAAAEVDPKTYGKEAERLKAPIFTSGGYVIDGHHRWAAMIGADMANGRGADMRMKTRNIKKNGKDVDIEEAVAFSNAFQHAMGIINQDRKGKPARKNFSDQELKISEEIAKSLGIKENKPQVKPQPQKEWIMGLINTRSSRKSLVESLLEAVKVKRDRNPQLGTIGYGVNPEDPARFVRSNVPLKARKTDAMGNLLSKPSAKGWKASEAATGNAIEMAQQLIATMNIKPTGTKFEVYGEKNGKPYTLKVKKIKKMGIDTYETAGSREVELKAAGTGLQVLDKRTRKVVLDRGNDMLWD